MPYSNTYLCHVKECKGIRKAKNYCPKHLARFKRYGDPLGGPGSGRKVQHTHCTIEGCEKKHCAKGMCQMHYRRHTLYGDVHMVNEPKRSDKRNINANGYVVVYAPENPTSTMDGMALEHRLVMAAHLGRPLQRHENVHHKNGVRHDNRIENLEIWDTRQPSGQRPEDKINFAIEILKQYAPNLLKDNS